MERRVESAYTAVLSMQNKASSASPVVKCAVKDKDIFIEAE